MIIHHTTGTIITDAGRDWVPIIVQLIGALASAAVAAFAIWLTNRQSTATREIAAHQAKIAEAKVIADLSDRRLSAWFKLEHAWTNQRHAIRNGLIDGMKYLVQPDPMVDFNDAASKIYFLFPTKISKEVEVLSDKFDSYYMATAAMRTSKGEFAVQARDGVSAIDIEIDEQITKLKMLVRESMDAGL